MKQVQLKHELKFSHTLVGDLTKRAAWDSFHSSSQLFVCLSFYLSATPTPPTFWPKIGHHCEKPFLKQF